MAAPRQPTTNARALLTAQHDTAQPAQHISVKAQPP